MSFSEAPGISNCPLVVCTNTWRDYAIAVRRGQVGAVVETIVVRHIAPSFGPVVVSGGPQYRGAVGLARVPRHADEWLAFRVFDVGVYEGRPHTVGVVAALVPPRARRTWRISALLAWLPAPTPGDEHYAGPQPAAEANAAGLEEAMRRLDEWEEQGQALPEGQAICFGVPDDLTPVIAFRRLDDTATPTRRRRRDRFLVVMAVAVIAAAILAGWLWSRPPPASPASSDTISTVGDDHRRDVLLPVLVSDFVSEGDFARASTVDLEGLAVEVAAAARKDLNTLAERLKTNIADPGVCKLLIENTLSDRQKSRVVGVPHAVARPKQTELDGAIRLLRAHRDLLRKGKDVSNSGEAALPRQVQRFREALEKVLQTH